MILQSTTQHKDTNYREERHRAIRRVTHIGSALDLGLAIAKMTAGWLAQSQALIADGVHSLSDLLTNFLVLFAAKEAHREADEQHPYGHERIEAMATVGLGLVLVLVALGIGLDAIRRLFRPELLLEPGIWALVVAALSVLAKEGIFRYTMHVANRLQSNLLRANAWHSRSDAISSIVVIIGVGGAMAGLPYVDAIAAVVVAVMIARIGIELGWGSVRELIDTGVEGRELAYIRDVILQVDGVRALHMLRTRRMGGNVLVDVHITLSDPRVSVSEGHQISEMVMAKLMESMKEVTDVTVHIDPEDDDVAPSNRNLPLRSEFTERLRRRWSSLNAANHIVQINLHYLNGKIDVEVILSIAILAQGAETRALYEAFQSAAQQEYGIGELRLLYTDQDQDQDQEQEPGNIDSVGFSRSISGETSP
uniref:Cation diffusion facilitator family transporter n=1 Tax=Candidatus Kentrum sp. MB TaxID=2138164 RepID=A0A451BFY5_9GAMM|nr:MAG: cation diffusion facilitator family transporter [Candidatus Kentron sp. MB]VFK35283.1 MAG: cation diffusion facilitator family transporter [Candidatus Kentron sp. MB]VFK77182.1 MAG: cation diffusion facilitator family transporter [Candidatus Kentron sp. MB]